MRGFSVLCGVSIVGLSATGFGMNLSSHSLNIMIKCAWLMTFGGVHVLSEFRTFAVSQRILGENAPFLFGYPGRGLFSLFLGSSCLADPALVDVTVSTVVGLTMVLNAICLLYTSPSPRDS
eukprot:TRINITY_DN13488_c0_g1_i2.p1 TRINITY_DN13488_c0_g1~~TRINITY_DN13488_c0_g1_i2.p1  ORF type:complete len:121 (+),score=16.32 TRINITY_DN13488_c0_g1_i2:160-522(+)